MKSHAKLSALFTPTMIKRLAMVFLALIVLVTSVGATYEMSARAQTARDFPPPGKLVDIGGRRIQLDCRGTGSPTVIFESGLDMRGSLSWSTVQDEIAKTTRACAYSRAGIMWSDPSVAHQNGKSVAIDLHATLNKAGEQGPFVLVGHSLGGPYIMTYTKYFGQDVAGLVFVDASHPEQVQRFEAIAKSPGSELSGIMDRMGAALAWTGVARAYIALTNDDTLESPSVPDSVKRAERSYVPTSLSAYIREEDSLDETLAEAGSFRKLGSRPLFVLTATAPLPKQSLDSLGITPDQGAKFQKTWEQMHDDQATWSSQSQHQLIPDSGHGIQFDRPDIVIAAVRSVIEKVHAKQNRNN